MSCPACTKAAQESCHDFELGCTGCAARMIARSHQKHDAANTHRGDPDYHVKRNRYRALLEQFGVTHEQVLEQARTDMLGKVVA